VLEGSLLLQVDGQAERTYKAGEAFQVPPVTIHGGLAGSTPLKLIGNYIVEKGKPLATPA
jgi:quercetin dioxygenase-like cupin family protein